MISAILGERKMGRWYSNKKTEADYLKKIEIWWLKKYGYLQGYKYGGMKWTHPSGKENSVSFAVSTTEESDSYIQFIYIQTDNSTREKKDFDYKVRLTTTPCNLGSKRFWFICPLVKNGVPCNKRIGVLYKDGDYFGCRHCYNLSYESRNLSPFQKPFGKIVSFPELEEMEKAVKTKFYKGKLTKRYDRFLKIQEKQRVGFYGSVMALDKRFKEK